MPRISASYTPREFCLGRVSAKVETREWLGADLVVCKNPMETQSKTRIRSIKSIVHAGCQETTPPYKPEESTTCKDHVGQRALSQRHL